jgi:hypothetical protein
LTYVQIQREDGTYALVPKEQAPSRLYHVHGAYDFVTDNISGDPVRITSRMQLKRLCAEHECTPSYGKGWV